jgi:hypothetical protein
MAEETEKKPDAVLDAVQGKAAEAVETAEETAKKAADAAAEEAKKIAKKDGEEEAQKWLENKLAGIEAKLGAEVAGIRSWMGEELNKFQQKVYEQTKEALSGKSSTPQNSTPVTPEKAAESSGSQSETSAAKSQKPAKKRHRI